MIDFVVLCDRVMFIELNPFMEGTGLGLFSWKNHSDQQILLGQKEFEFRVLEHPPDNQLDFLLPKWRDIASDLI